MNTIDNEKIYMISAIIMIAVFVVRMPVMLRPRNFRYEHSARTVFEKDDHTYVFQIRMLKDGSYRCYVVKAPYLYGKRLSRYAVSIAEENNTGNRYIFCNRKIKSADDAMKLCDSWSDANQHYVDSGRYRE